MHVYLMWSVSWLDAAPHGIPYLSLYLPDMDEESLEHANIASLGGIYRLLVLGLSFVRTSKTAWS